MKYKEYRVSWDYHIKRNTVRRPSLWPHQIPADIVSSGFPFVNLRFSGFFCDLTFVLLWVKGQSAGLFVHCRLYGWMWILNLLYSTFHHRSLQIRRIQRGHMRGQWSVTVCVYVSMCEWQHVCVVLGVGVCLS